MWYVVRLLLVLDVCNLVVSKTYTHSKYISLKYSHNLYTLFKVFDIGIHHQSNGIVSSYY